MDTPEKLCLFLYLARTILARKPFGELIPIINQAKDTPGRTLSYSILARTLLGELCPIPYWQEQSWQEHYLESFVI